MHRIASLIMWAKSPSRAVAPKADWLITPDKRTIRPPGLHICHVVDRPRDERGEYVEIANDGADAALLSDLSLSRGVNGRAKEIKVFSFPSAGDGDQLTLDPGQSAFVFTGSGRPGVDMLGNRLLFADRRRSVWLKPDHVALLRGGGDELLDSMRVDEPKRHPLGH